MKEKKEAPKVCFATAYYPPDTIGGVARTADRIVKYLVEYGFDVHVITTGNREITQDEMLQPDSVPIASDENGASIYRIPIIRTTKIFLDMKHAVSIAAQSFYWAIHNLDRILSFDIFHGLYLPMAYPCLLVAGRGKRPVIASIMGNEIENWALDALVAPFIIHPLQRASWVTSVNTDYLGTAAGLADIANRSSFIPNAIDNSAFPKWQPIRINKEVLLVQWQDFQRQKIFPF